MNKTLSLTTATIISLGAAILSPTSATAREIDCVNYWVNPTNNMVQCFNEDFKFTGVPFYYSSASNSISEDFVSRRNTAIEMVMPDLIGKKIDFAEDYLLNMGVTLGSKSVHAQNKFAGEIVQQTPLAGAKLTQGQTVLLEYMGAVVVPQQIK